MSQKFDEKDLFDKARNGFLNLDPAYFIQNNLTLDGAEFRIIGNGWKFMVDIYRYVGLQAAKKTGKPVVIKKGRQVGGTMMAAAMDLYFTNGGLFNNPGMRVLHAFPDIPKVKRFSQDKLEGLIRTAKDDFINKNKLKGDNAVDNITMKQFNNGTLWIESVGNDGDRIRGMTVDAIFFDECQDMYGNAINNSTKTLTAAKYGPPGKGIQVYFGTPKERSSYFATIWEMSDQRYYYLGCINCKKTYPFYLPDSDSWKEVWISGYIIKCPHCGCEQSKIDAIERGEWKSSRADSKDCKFIGFHVNQLLIPYFTKETILDLMPENNPAQTERAWKNEVLGEFYSGYGFTLSKNEIYDLCRDPDRTFSKRIAPNSKQTYLGVDWGGKSDNDDDGGGQSYSCVVILSAEKDGTLLVEHAHKLQKQTFDYKKETINEMYRRFSIQRGVSDWFFGQDVVNDLQMIHRDKFLGAQGSGSLTAPLKYREDEMIISYNKDLLIEEIFDLFRKGKIRMPWGSYEHIEWLIDHCASMETKIRVVGGQPVKTYVKGNIPNDGLMALMYAYMAYKFDITRGFSFRPGIDTQPAGIKPILAHVPKMRI